MPDPNKATPPVVPAPQNTDPGTPPDIQSKPLDAPAAPPITENQPAPQPKKPVPNGDDLNFHHGALGEIFQTLAGGKKKEWTQTENGPVATYRDLKPGEMARGILAAAITGLAGGYDSANRGKGPAMSDAFSGGFKANEKRVEKQQGKEEGEAQDQFKNDNLSQERALRKHADAREQQKFIQESQLSNLRQHQLRDEIARGEISDKSLKDTTDEQDMLKAQHLESFGATKALGADGKPLEFLDAHALSIYANDPAHKMQVFGAPGQYKIVPQRDPSTNKFYIYHMAPDDDTPQWLGVKLDKDRQPMLDKDGDKIIDKDHPVIDPVSGKPYVPGEMMTPAFARRLNAESLATQAEQLKLAKNSFDFDQERKDVDERQKNDANLQTAQKHFQLAGGDPTAIDPATQKPYITLKDANTLQNANNDKWYANTNVYLKAQDELSKVREKDSSDPTIPALTAMVEAARDRAVQSNNTQLILSNGPLGEDMIVNNIHKRHADPTGKDADAVKKEISNLPQTRQDSILKKLKDPTPPELVNSVSIMDTKTQDERQKIIDTLDQTKFSADDIAFLTEKYALKAPPAQPKPASVGKIIQGAAYKLAIPGVSNPEPEPAK
jgi:hypothetical protein